MPALITPGPAECKDQSVLTAKPTLVYGVPAPERQRAIVARYGSQTAIRWTMADRNGRPIDLTACVAGGSSVGMGGTTFDSGGIVTGNTPEIILRLREMVASGGIVATFSGYVLDPATGLVEVPIAETQLANLPGPGVYIAELALVEVAGYPNFSDVFTLYLEPSLFKFSQCSGPPTIAEIRLGLRDSSPAEKRLLDTVTFDDAEIALAVVRPVQYFNEITPQLETCGYTTQNFPWRYHWTRGAAGVLFTMVEQYYRDNKLPYAAGGISVSDMDKDKEYSAAADKAWGEFTTWAKAQKAQLSQNECWGSVSSPYAWGSGYGNGWGGWSDF